MAKKEKHFKCFDAYLDWVGAEKIQLTNPYELHRFIANEIVCVVYNSKRGLSFSNDEARNVYNAFLDKKKITINGTKRQKFKNYLKDKLIERDGLNCFYTGIVLTRETATIEHLIPLSRGGKNNMHNLVLCSEESNKEVADLPLVEKIKYRDKFRLK